MSVKKLLLRTTGFLLAACTLTAAASPALGMPNAQTGPDVGVTGVALPTGPIVKGETVTITVTVKNFGSTSASVEVILNSVSSMGDTEIVGLHPASTVAAGVAKEETFDWDTSNVALGSYNFQAFALLDGNGDDGNFGNNFLVTATPLSVIEPPVVQPPAKDVAVTQVNLPAGPVEEGAIVDVEVTVANLGTETVSVTLSLVDTQGLTQDVQIYLEPLATGESVTATIPWDTTGATGGEYKILAEAFVEEEAGDQVDNNSLVSMTSITIVSYRLILDDGSGQTFPGASFGRKMEPVSVDTPVQPVTELMVFGGSAKTKFDLSPPVITTSPVPLKTLLTANAQATFGPGSAMLNPFELGHIIGTINLEERQSSLGAFVAIDGQAFFANENGIFNAMLPMGVYDLEILAPGYVPARIPGVRLGIGEGVTVPELTLSFGDANGDGRVDILDLIIAAGNFGAAREERSPP